MFIQVVTQAQCGSSSSPWDRQNHPCKVLCTVMATSTSVPMLPFNRFRIISRFLSKCPARLCVTKAVATPVDQGRLSLGIENLSPELENKLKSVKSWIVFSDLHVHERHEPQWQQALDVVDKLAREHNSGCLFLGDFWEARTSVKHATLNQVQKIMSGWEHPTIAIVGNHDQVNNSGTEHGMLLLESLNSNWAVITSPTLFMDALWLPYR